MMPTRQSCSQAPSPTPSTPVHQTILHSTGVYAQISAKLKSSVLKFQQKSFVTLKFRVINKISKLIILHVKTNLVTSYKTTCLFV